MIQDSRTLLMTRGEISRTIQRMGREIKRDYEGKSPLLVGVLKGSFIFLSDLVREIGIPLTVDFFQAQSYVSTESTGQVSIASSPLSGLQDRHVIIVEDIVDTGITISHLMKLFQAENPASLKLCSFLDKPYRRDVPVKVDYVGIVAPNKFVVGYGMDLDQEHRYLPDLWTLDDAGSVA
jgi:hypoxanthine phosphoribosyltransferase